MRLPVWIVKLWRVLPPLMLLFTISSVQSSNSIVDKAKAGFIHNFTKYTHWSDIQVNRNLLICTLNKEPLSGYLEALNGRQVQSRVIRVRLSEKSDQWSDCDVLYITSSEVKNLEEVLNNVRQFPVLTISDAPGFVHAGGIIGLKLRASRIRFDINQGAADSAGLKLSSQLLKLADQVLP
mgnify:CR=1 FL=1